MTAVGAFLWTNLTGVSMVFIWGFTAALSFRRWQDHVLFGASALMLLTTLTSFGCAAVLTMRLWRWLRNAAEASEVPIVVLNCGTRAHEMGLPWPDWRFWLGCGVEVEWIRPEGAGISFAHKGGELVTFERRGVHEKVLRRVKITDPFRLFRLFPKCPEQKCHLTVYPAESLPQGCALMRPLGGEAAVASAAGRPEGDLMDIRQYQQGDSSRNIAWKAVARSGGQKMFVRTPETALEDWVGIFLHHGKGDEASAELAMYAIENEIFGRRWMFGASGVRTIALSSEHQKSKTHAKRIIAQSGSCLGTSDSEADIRDFEAKAARFGIRDWYVLLPLDLEAWPVRWLAKAPGRRHRLVGVRCQSDVEKLGRRTATAVIMRQRKS